MIAQNAAIKMAFGTVTDYKEGDLYNLDDPRLKCHRIGREIYFSALGCEWAIFYQRTTETGSEKREFFRHDREAGTYTFLFEEVDGKCSADMESIINANISPK